MNEICRSCGSTESQIVDDARTLGLLKELQSGIYTCCQIVVWADEQWLAWVEAAEEDSKAVDDVTRPLESADGAKQSLFPFEGLQILVNRTSDTCRIVGATLPSSSARNKADGAPSVPRRHDELHEAHRRTLAHGGSVANFAGGRLVK
jgi:hypothetical protein